MKSELDYLVEVIELLKRILLDHGVVKWLDLPMEKLSWATPVEAIRHGRGEEVLEIAKSYLEPVF